MFPLQYSIFLCFSQYSLLITVIFVFQCWCLFNLSGDSVIINISCANRSSMFNDTKRLYFITVYSKCVLLLEFVLCPPPYKQNGAFIIPLFNPLIDFKAFRCCSDYLHICFDFSIYIPLFITSVSNYGRSSSAKHFHMILLSIESKVDVKSIKSIHNSCAVSISLIGKEKSKILS